MRFFKVGCDYMSGELNVSLLFAGEINSEEAQNVFLAKSRYDMLEAKVHSGTKLTYDAISNSNVVPVLYSEKFFEVLRSVQATGYTQIPVEIITKKNDRVSGFSILCVKGRSGPIDRSRSIPTMNPPRVPGGKEFLGFKGMYFDEGSWDGSDFFVPEGTIMTAISQKIADVISQAKLKNVAVAPLDSMMSSLTEEKIVESFGKKKFAEWKLQKLV